MTLALPENMSQSDFRRIIESVPLEERLSTSVDGDWEEDADLLATGLWDDDEDIDEDELLEEDDEDNSLTKALPIFLLFKK